MQFGGPTFVLAIIAISTIGWIITTAIRARHGYPVTDDWGRNVDRHDPIAKEETCRLSSENTQLRAELAAIKERLSNVELIVTDGGFETSAQIEALRSPRIDAR